MDKEEEKNPPSIRVSMRLPFKTYEAMKEASSHLGFTTVGRTVTWFALLGLQAASATSAAQRSALASEQMLAMWRGLEAAQAEEAAEAAKAISEGKK